MFFYSRHALPSSPTPLRIRSKSLFAVLLAGALLWSPQASHAASLTVKLSNLTPSPSPLHRVRLRVSISPLPTPVHPRHLHFYLDGRMLLMRSFTTSPTTLTLPPLSPGRHEITVREADALTHKEMSDGDSMEGMKRHEKDMDGMDMGGMDMGDMKMGEDNGMSEKEKGKRGEGAGKAPHPLATLVIMEREK